MSKRSQAAMEFLMTYGWAILLVLIVMAALVYLGVLNPSKLLPDKCVFTQGIQCKDYIAYSQGFLFGGGSQDIVFTDNGMQKKLYSLTLDLVNGLGKGIYINKINIAGDEGFSCAQIQEKSCEGETVLSFDSNLQPQINPFSKCFSMADVCNDLISSIVLKGGSLPEGTTQGSLCDSKQLLFWPSGAALSQRLANLEDIQKALNIRYYSIPCTGMPPKGKKVKAVITVEYYENDPNFTHVATGDLFLTVQ